jgi:hypothetical protein
MVGGFLIASSLLVVVGFYIRKITETPAENSKKEQEEVKTLFHLTEIYIKPVDFGTFAAITTFSVLSHDGVYTELGYLIWVIPKGFS